MKRLALVLALTCAMALNSSAFAAGVPAYSLGFEALASQIPDIVGTPLEDEHYGANGDSLQQTTTGLMVWRKADNWTAFTNGGRTWINGPFGIQERANEERFDWELATQFAVASATPAAPPTEAAEIAALEMINRSRQDYGVAPLVMDETLRRVAQADARDMSVRNFFAHVNPDGLQPWDRAKAAGVSFSAMSENIGWSMGFKSPTDGVRSNHESMMAETPPNDGHRVNILNPRFKKIGIGVYVGSDRKVLYVADFIG